MDAIDYKLLALLQANARVTNTEMARQVGMVPSGVLERVRKLEEQGVVREYTARLQPEILGLGLTAFIFVRTNERPGIQATSEALEALPEVLELHHIAGEDCYLVKARVADTAALAVLLREKIAGIPSVTSTRSTIVLETIKETTHLPLPPG
jgi:Lrp/AsnC family leucine-responsive transcriptional regulator